jgi:hypothetical protein
MFPFNLWDKLLPQALITLNSMCASRINPRLSAWAQVRSTFDCNRTPLAPPGTKVLVHKKTDLRETWAPHAINHCQCYQVLVSIHEKTTERIADTLVWQLARVAMPAASSAEAATAAAIDLIEALLHPSPASPLALTSNSKHEELQQLAKFFKSATETALTPASTSLSAPTGFKNLSRHMECQIQGWHHPAKRSPSMMRQFQGWCPRTPAQLQAPKNR